MSCYSQDSVRSKVIVETPFGPHPLASCNAQLHWNSVPSSPKPTGLLCILPNGSLGGFPPSTKFKSCSSMGLVAFSRKISHPDVLAFEEAAHNYFADHVCPDDRTARRAMQDLIRKVGLQDWKVRIHGSTNTIDCATLAIEPSRRRVDIIPVDQNGN
jgi:hypothetical protein